ncbi:right-handed parallel beta-helix repeat-containing protein [Candidatus Thorarchaeota archaeon]|nr:MAG: right-handed parallel beta-helix repeat-containing protein [Candidatus Thorarchaeota archaeon]
MGIPVRKQTVLLLTVFLGLAVLNAHGFTASAGASPAALDKKLVSLPAFRHDNLTEIDFISISGNDDFREKADEYGWPGSGMEWDPFLIEGYYFRNTYHMFVVTGTDVYWKFQNNILDGIDDRWCEIVISNLRNADISNNRFISGSVGIHTIRVNDSRFFCNEMYNQSWDGIYMEFSHRNMVAYNTFHDLGEGGVYAWQASTHNTIANNVVRNCPYGFLLHAGATHNTIRANHVLNISQCGLDIQTSDNLVSSNRIHDVGGHAIAVGREGTEIKGNLIYNNSGWGINAASTSGDLDIHSNVLLFNEGGGIALQRSEQNEVVENDLYHNADIQALSYGDQNTFCHNYWHEWIGNDTDGNGIIDIPKEIAGGTSNDTTPSSLPNNAIPGWYCFEPIDGPPPIEPEPTTTTGTPTATNSTSLTATEPNLAAETSPLLPGVVVGGVASVAVLVSALQIQKLRRQ